MVSSFNIVTSMVRKTCLRDRIFYWCSLSYCSVTDSMYFAALFNETTTVRGFTACWMCSYHWSVKLHSKVLIMNHTFKIFYKSFFSWLDYIVYKDLLVLLTKNSKKEKLHILHLYNLSKRMIEIILWLHIHKYIHILFSEQ